MSANLFMQFLHAGPTSAGGQRFHTWLGRGL
jgi:hypothetical protein